MTDLRRNGDADIANKALVLDLVEWVAVQPRPYSDVMEAWRTSCPRLTIWEDAVDQGFVVRERCDGAGVMVRVTDAGVAFLRGERGGTYPHDATSVRTINT